MKNLTIAFPVLVALLIYVCRKEKESTAPAQLNTVPEFYLPALEAEYGLNQPEMQVFANSGDKINIPQDLDFHPTRFMELWVLNKDAENSGGSTVTITNAGKGNQSVEWRRDGNAWHFMSVPSAIAFSNNGNFATSPNVLDANHQGGKFTGPSLWTSDMNIYAKPSGGNGSHLDMLHASPYSMGIAAEKDNTFWLFDGFNGNLVRYNFDSDHGPGNADHANGKIHRYSEIKLKRNPTVPSHLVLDGNKEWLYVVDGGNKQILRVNIKTGSKLKDLNTINEPLAEYWEMSGVQYEVFAETGFVNPSGIEIKDNRLFVADYETGVIIVLDINSRKELGRLETGKKGITGLKIDPEGKLWFVNALSNEVIRVDPK
ncbi:MAG: NHL repeat-containing protein [Bacteroidia bacterium]